MADMNDDLLDQATRALRETTVPEGPAAEVIASVKRMALRGPADVPDARRAGAAAGAAAPHEAFTGCGAAATAPSLPRAAIAGIAAALLCLAAGSCLALFFVVSGPSLALADAVQNATQARSVTFVQRIQAGEQTILQLKGHLQGDDLRWELPNGIACVESQKERRGMLLDMHAKEAAQYDLPSDDSESLWQTNPIEWLQRITLDDAQFLGQQVVDGRRVDAFSGTCAGLFSQGTSSYGFPPVHAVRIWVDQQTNLPLRIEIADPQRTAVIVFSQMRWNEPLDTGLFALDIPDGFSVLSFESFRSRFPQSTSYGRPLE